jgi:hypothetical protein
MASGRTIINALIGAVVGIVLSFIPFSTIVGGAVAGFLEGPDERDGLLAGALAGVITFVPIAAIAVLAIGFIGFGMGVAAAPVEGFAFITFVILVAVSFALLYTVGLSLLGGYLGAYLAQEYPVHYERTREAIGMGRSTPPSRTAGRSVRRDRNRSTRSEAKPESSSEPSRWREERDHEK